MGSREKMAQYDAKRTSIDAARTENDTCRRRIGQLLDVESFVELDSLVTARELSFGPERPKVTGDGVVTGYGTIDGRLVFLAAQDPDVYGGSIGQMHAKKMQKHSDWPSGRKSRSLGFMTREASEWRRVCPVLRGLVNF